ncbi:MAG TPA: hypothetical protein VFQ20_00215 [Burkholderiaceae bacterium]|nr:hypothetical protein [Burkholderiaceae bacterium]
MTADDDTLLDAWLALREPDLRDDGFSAAVMRRVHAEQAAGQATLDAGAALDRLQRRERSARRRGRWQWVGVGAGGALAAAVFALAGDARDAVVAGPQVVALLVGLAAAAWWLTDAAEA